MTPEFRANLRTTFIIIGANVLINGTTILVLDALRQHAMHDASKQRAAMSQKLDDARDQRERLTASLMAACRRD